MNQSNQLTFLTNQQIICFAQVLASLGSTVGGTQRARCPPILILSSPTTGRAVSDTTAPRERRCRWPAPRACYEASRVGPATPTTHPHYPFPAPHYPPPLHPSPPLPTAHYPPSSPITPPITPPALHYPPSHPIVQPSARLLV